MDYLTDRLQKAMCGKVLSEECNGLIGILQASYLANFIFCLLIICLRQPNIAQVKRLEMVVKCLELEPLDKFNFVKPLALFTLLILRLFVVLLGHNGTHQIVSLKLYLLDHKLGPMIY